MKRICIILPGKLPIPNIMGGAVETLMTLLLEENEKSNKIYFIIISAWAEGVEAANAKYKNAEFHYVRVRHLFLKKAVNLINYIIAIVTGNIDFFPTPFHCEVRKIMDNIRADAVIVEHGVYKHFGFLRKSYSKDQLYLHWHGAGPLPDYETKETFGHIITVSNFLKDWYMKGFEGYTTQFHVCLNGIDERNFMQRISGEERESLRNHYNVRKEDLLIIYCGRLVKEKGVKEIARAIINTNNPHIKLMIVGSAAFKEAKSTDYEQEIREMVREHAEKIFLTGYVDNEKLYKYYQIADLQVICSICEEAAALVAIEGMMSGLPLVVTDSGGISEYTNNKGCIVVDKGTALYDEADSIRLSNQLTKILCDLEADRGKLLQLSKWSTENSRKCTGEKYYERFVDIFCE